MAKHTKLLDTWCIEKSRLNLLQEWDYECNAHLTPQNINYNSSKLISWKCTHGHSWDSSVAARTIFKLDCPFCNPKMNAIPIGSKYGCLTIIDGFEAYSIEVMNEKILNLERNKFNLLNGIKNLHSNIESIDTYDEMIKSYKNIKRYKCECKCGKILFLEESAFLRKKHRYCPSNDCGLKQVYMEKLQATYIHIYDASYDFDLTNTIHESLEILECVDANYKNISMQDSRLRKGVGTVTIYKIYKSRCYLCGKVQEFKSSDFSINPPSDYGPNAYNGYYSNAFCKCHEISSFQWITTKLLKENNIPYRVEYSFKNLFGVYNKNNLRYDFVIFHSDGSIKCLLECQGEQHYKPINKFGGNSQFKVQQKNDEIKRKYANDNNIKLYEIPYTKKNIKDIQTFLSDNGIL